MDARIGRMVMVMVAVAGRGSAQDLPDAARVAAPADARTGDGAVWCWDACWKGQSPACRVLDAPLPASRLWALRVRLPRPATAVAAGSEGYARLNDGTVASWAFDGGAPGAPALVNGFDHVRLLGLSFGGLMCVVRDDESVVCVHHGLPGALGVPRTFDFHQ